MHAEAAPPRAALDDLAQLIQTDLQSVEWIISERMQSKVGMIPDLAGHLVEAGGKRVRPVVTLLAARACAADPASTLNPEAAAKLGAAVEFIHTATLLHDDVVDESGLRRGKAAAHRIWGNSASVLVGDYLFAKAFRLMVETHSIRILDILAQASSIIAEGEVLQLANAANWQATREDYMTIIEAKTAALFAAAAEAGAVCAQASEERASALHEYGRRIGLAFQLVDDALDYDGSTAALGKNIGDDLRDRKMTLPIIIARELGGAEAQSFISRVFGTGLQSTDDLQTAITLVQRTQSIRATIDEAKEQARFAKACLLGVPSSLYRDALIDLADFSVARIS